MQDELRHGRHVVFRLHVHLVFVPKYRRKIFDADALDRLKNALSTVCGAFEATLDEFNGERDHVHLLVQYPPKVSISALVNSLKGVSARRLRQDRPDIARRYWRGGLWSASYFAASCGGAPIEVLRQYIEQQRAPE
ncbi:MAG: IS200/IS605 family transposase [Candidatus Contendobacter sp.]|nr:IS200/IS605 family transposase [Candidatus Contendobacter sp.]